MLVRIVFLLLLAANIGVAAWLFVAPPRAAPAMAPADPGVAPLVLLSERETGSAEVASAELASAPQSPADAARDRCLRIGPFPSQVDLRRAFNALTPHVDRIQYRESRNRQSRGFLVYLPPPETRETALAIARQLSAKGVRDYYVVTAGEQQNSISLGLFRSRDNAERRRAELAALSFAPAIAERVEELPAYWVDLAYTPESGFDWRDHLPDFLDATEQTIPCF